MHKLVQAGDMDAARAVHPPERPYPVGTQLAHHLEMIER
jgi:hypothetical protein